MADDERKPLSPESIARLKALQGRFAEHSVTRGGPQPNGGMDRAGEALERLRQWALSKSPYGEEIILHRCNTCGAVEYVDEASGRLKLDHIFAKHQPITVPAHEGEVMPVRRPFGERDDDDDAIFGSPRRAAGY